MIMAREVQKFGPMVRTQTLNSNSAKLRGNQSPKSIRGIAPPMSRPPEIYSMEAASSHNMTYSDASEEPARIVSNNLAQNI